MKVALGTIKINDYERRALASHLGHSGLATRETVREYVLSNGLTDLEVNVIPEYEANLERHGR